MENCDQLLPRNYQYELFEISCKQNSIIALDTGSGKTFIALLLIKEFGHQIRGRLSDGAKRTVFVVNTVPLVYQQQKFLQDHTIFSVGHFEGSMGVDFWTADKWTETIDQFEVLVMVAQVFSDALNHQHIKLQDINLIIADECHHATKKHPMREIFRFYCEAMQDSVNNVPRVLGLTACIVQGSPSESTLPVLMKELESTMNCALVTSVFQDTVRKFSTHAREVIIEYKSEMSTDTMQLYDKILDKNEEEAMKYVPNLTDERANVVKKLFRELRLALHELGQFSFSNAIAYELDSIDESGDTEPDTELLLFLRNKLLRLKEHFDSNPIPYNCFFLFISNKVKRLLGLLEKCNEDSAIIVFVERRNTAKLLCELLIEVSRRSDSHSFLLPKWVVGGTRSAKGDICVKQVEAQKETLHLFRKGLINILVSTSVLEEGIDMRACNVIVRFDPIKEYRSYVQSLGRARAYPSWFIVMCPEGELMMTKLALSRYKNIKNNIISACHDRSLPGTDDIKEHYNDSELEAFAPYGTDGSRITANSVLQVVNKYIGQLPSDRFTKLAIEETRLKLGDLKKIGLRLPINAKTTETFWSEERSNFNLAKRDAALKMCKRLYELECFTEKLLPKPRSFANETYKKYVEIEKEIVSEGQPAAGTRKRSLFYERRICSSFKLAQTFYLNVVDFETTLDFCGHPIFENKHNIGFISSQKVKCPLFYLRSHRWNNLQISVRHYPVCLNFEQLHLIKHFHEQVYKKVLRLDDLVFQPIRDLNHLLLVPLIECNIDYSLLDNMSDELVCKTYDKTGFSQLKGAVVRKKHKSCGQLYYVTEVCMDLSPSSAFPYHKQEFSSYLDYYKKIYNVDISDHHQPLLLCKAYAYQLNYVSASESRNVSGMNFIHLIPELCDILAVSASLWWKILCMPSILFRINGLELEKHVMRSMKLPITDQFLNSTLDADWSQKEIDGILDGSVDNIALSLLHKQEVKVFPGMILQALTSIHSGDIFHLERLEMLGDAFLKFHTGRFLFCDEKSQNEGFLSENRSRIVSNSTLSTLAKNIRLPELCQNVNLNTSPFAIPFGFQVKKDIETLLISKKIPSFEWNTYFKNEKIQTSEKPKCNSFRDQEVSDKCAADIVEALIGAMLLAGGERQAVECMNWIGLTFAKMPYEKPKSALRTENNQGSVDFQFKKANLNCLEEIIGYEFREKSFLLEACTHPSCQSNKLTDCYQRLEFLGDSVLDFLITTHIYASRPKNNPGQMTDLRTYYVNNETLANISLKLQIYKFLLYHSSSLQSAISDAIYEKSRPLNAVSEPSNLFLPIEKVLGDQVEAIIGAIYCDSDFTYQNVWNVIKRLYKDIFLEEKDEIPVEPVRAIYEYSPKTKFTKFQTEGPNGPKTYQLEIPGFPIMKRSCANFKNAKKLVAEDALKYIRENAQHST